MSDVDLPCEHTITVLACAQCFTKMKDQLADAERVVDVITQARKSKDGSTFKMNRIVAAELGYRAKYPKKEGGEG